MSSSTFDPWLKSFATDLTGDLFSTQYFGQCADLEMKLLNCLDAYGLNRGLKKCEDLMVDFKECVYKTKQLDRISAMRNERQRQWKNGERNNENRYAPGPQADSYHND